MPKSGLMVGTTLWESLNGRVKVWEAFSWGREDSVSGSMLGVTVKNLSFFLNSLSLLE